MKTLSGQWRISVILSILCLLYFFPVLPLSLKSFPFFYFCALFRLILSFISWSFARISSQQAEYCENKPLNAKNALIIRHDLGLFTDLLEIISDPTPKMAILLLSRTHGRLCVCALVCAMIVIVNCHNVPQTIFHKPQQPSFERSFTTNQSSFASFPVMLSRQILTLCKLFLFFFLSFSFWYLNWANFWLN